MNGRVKEIWRKHKVKIIIGGAVVGGVIIYAATRKAPVSNAITEAVEEISFGFDNIEDAIAKFKEIEGAQKLAEKGEVALIGGYHPEYKSYTVIDV